MLKYTINFMNIAPDTVEVQHVETTDVSGLSVPADAMQFTFFGEDRKWVAPSYFVTEDVDVGDLAGLKSRHPDAHFHCDADAETFALVTWTHPEGSRWNGKILVPLNADFAVVARKDLAVVGKSA
jgi:hypothetical protein